MLDRYLLTLFLTLVIEESVAYALGLRKSAYILVIAMANIITHLLLNYLLIVLGFLGIDAPFLLIVTLEILIVVAEWQLLVYVFSNPKKRFLAVSFLGNTTSFLVGLLLFWT